MDTLFWLNLGSPMVQGVLQLRFLVRFTGKKARFWHFPAYLVLILAINALVPSKGPATALETLALYGTARLRNGRSASCVAAVLSVYVSLLSYGAVNSLEQLFFPYISSERLLCVFIVLAELSAIAANAGCYVLLLRFFSLGGTEAYAWMLLPLGLFLPLNEFYILNYAYGNVVIRPSPLEPGKHLTLLVLQSISLAALISALYAYKRICRGFETQAALAALRQEARAQKIYVAEAQTRYEQTRAFRHDIQNHLTVLAGLLKTDCINDAKKYMNSLAQAAGELSPPVHTGNPIVDVLLRDKLSLADAGGVRTVLSLALPRTCVVEDLDWCILFANALDNALHACRRVEGEASIRISGTRQGDFYLLEFQNTRPDEPLQPAGTGLRNIRAAAEKYHGAMAAEADGPAFRLHILLDISRPPDGISEQSP